VRAIDSGSFESYRAWFVANVSFNMLLSLGYRIGIHFAYYLSDVCWVSPTRSATSPTGTPHSRMQAKECLSDAELAFVGSEVNGLEDPRRRRGQFNLLATN
jgi:hypothetical protein